jgi:hypothetical protein
MDQRQPPYRSPKCLAAVRLVRVAIFVIVFLFWVTVFPLVYGEKAALSRNEMWIIYHRRRGLMPR